MHIYALADLCEPFWSASIWWRRGGAVVGVVGLPENGGHAVYAVASRDRTATLDLVDELADDLPPGAIVTGPVGVAEVLARRRPVAWHRTYHRYWLASDADLGPVDEAVMAVGRDATSELLDLYAIDPGAAFFTPAMLDDETFVAVAGDDGLIAAAGTHVMAAEFGVAAIGSVMTHPRHRRRGLGRAVTVGVIERLRGRVATIGLNCADANTAARELYGTMGFEPLLAYEEAELA